MTNKIAVGIDLGTTSSCVAVYKNEKITIISNPEGYKHTPSEVAFRGLDRLIGNAAQQQGALNPKNTIFYVKRFIGRKFDDPALQADRKRFPFTIVADKLRPLVEVEFKDKVKKFTAEEISAMVLQKMKNTAERSLGHQVHNAVITVPTYFNQTQRIATKNAAIIAGFREIRIVQDSIAAALSFGLENKITKNKKVLIFDFGGGTLDVSIISVWPDLKFEVVAASGDTNFGGLDFDQKLLDHFVKEFDDEHLFDIIKVPRTMRRLRNACEVLKKHLSTSVEAKIEVDSLFAGVSMLSKMTRPKFEDLCADLFSRILEPVEAALNDAKIDRSEIDEIVLVGGSTRIPKVQQLLTEFFNGKELNHSINPDEAIACGAAVYAAALSEVNSFKALQQKVRDITPLGVNVKVLSKPIDTVFARNTPIPTEKVLALRTVSDFQTCVTFEIFEEGSGRGNISKFGKFYVDGIPPLKRGQADVAVKFHIDWYGILNIAAMERATSTKLAVSIERDFIDTLELSQMAKEMSDYEEDEIRRREGVEAKEVLEKYVYEMQSYYKENVTKMLQEEEEAMSNVLKEVLDWLENEEKPYKKDFESRYMLIQQICEPIIANQKNRQQECNKAYENIQQYLKKVSNFRMKNREFMVTTNFNESLDLSSFCMKYENKPRLRETSTKEVLEEILEEIKLSCEPIMERVIVRRIEFDEEERIKSKKRLFSFLTKTQQTIDESSNFMNVPNSEVIKSLLGSLADWCGKNESATKEIYDSKYHEFDKCFQPILNAINIRKKRYLEGKRVEARLRYMNYLNSINDELEENLKNVSKSDGEIIKRQMREEVSWLDDNENARTKTIDQRYNQAVRTWEEIIAQIKASKTNRKSCTIS